ncbi:MAG: hypothetical protein ACTHJW_08625 [Streptosporangiaceae bacterium]
MKPAGVCCERCPGATLANTRHIARRRLLKAAVFQPQAGSGLAPGTRGASGSRGSTGSTHGAAKRERAGISGDPGGYDPGAASQHRVEGQTGSSATGGGHNGHWTPSHGSAPGIGPAPGNLYRAVTGKILDVSPQVIAIGDKGGERRFALTADATAWRGGPLDPAALSRGDEAIIRLLPSRPGVADKIWANIGRVTGVIVECDSASVLVNEGATKSPQKVVIPRNASGRVEVKLPNMRPGYMIDIIGIRHPDYLEGLVPVNPQPPYRSDKVVHDKAAGGRLPESIAGSAIWHDSADEPYGVLGISYPAIDPAADCAEVLAGRYPPGQAPAFRQLPYLAVGTALNVRNECTGIAWTLPVTGCAPMARLFNDRCVACATSPRGRVADLTVASFVALGGDLEAGCFSTTLTIGR